MIRALAAALLLAACASEPIQPIEPLDIDPLAFETVQLEVRLPPAVPLVGVGAREDTYIVLQNPPITAICRNGWTSYSQHRRGTCSGHGGVREWVNRPAE